MELLDKTIQKEPNAIKALKYRRSCEYILARNNVEREWNEEKMPLHCRIFQKFYSNRLRRHPFIYVSQHKAQNAYTGIGDAGHQFRRSKSDIITNKNQIQHINGTDYVHHIQPNHSQRSSSETLPFDAIPCADQNARRFNKLFTIAYQIRQLLEDKWSNRFHEEIDECHQKLGPIFRKSLTPNQSGKKK